MENVKDYRLDPPAPPKPKVVTICAHCGRRIFEGDDYYKTPAGDFCPDCCKLKSAENEDW